MGGGVQDTSSSSLLSLQGDASIVTADGAARGEDAPRRDGGGEEEDVVLDASLSLRNTLQQGLHQLQDRPEAQTVVAGEGLADRSEEEEGDDAPPAGIAVWDAVPSTTPGTAEGARVDVAADVLDDGEGSRPQTGGMPPPRTAGAQTRDGVQEEEEEGDAGTAEGGAQASVDVAADVPEEEGDALRVALRTFLSEGMALLGSLPAEQSQAHTPHPTPHTPHPQPSTLNPQPSTINRPCWTSSRAVTRSWRKRSAAWLRALRRPRRGTPRRGRHCPERTVVRRLQRAFERRRHQVRSNGGRTRRRS